MESSQVDKSICNVVATGSTGNCIIYHNSIAVDMGVPYSVIKPYLYDLQIILLSHEHQDHIRISTLRRLVSERPTLRIACGEWMLEHLKGIKNVDVLERGRLYDYGPFQVSPVLLYHDTENYGWRIFREGYKIIHATDTNTLNGISAPGYDLYSIEANYDEDTIDQLIAEKEAKGEYAYQKGAVNSHLSEQQARDWLYKNKGPHSKVVRLHETSTAL